MSQSNQKPAPHKLIEISPLSYVELFKFLFSLQRVSLSLQKLLQLSGDIMLFSKSPMLLRYLCILQVILKPPFFNYQWQLLSLPRFRFPLTLQLSKKSDFTHHHFLLILHFPDTRLPKGPNCRAKDCFFL